jgi:hypothetical protein
VIVGHYPHYVPGFVINDYLLAHGFAGRPEAQQLHGLFVDDDVVQLCSVGVVVEGVNWRPATTLMPYTSM